MGQIELNRVLILSWIVWDRTVFDIETVLTLNGIVWKGFDIQLCVNKFILILNWIVWIITVCLNWIAFNGNVFDNWIVYSCKTELTKTDLIICIKMDLALKSL